MPRIFISYRRADSQTTTERIYDRLTKTYNSRDVFKDIDNILAGQDFRVVLQKATNECDVMLVIIGKKWLSITDSKGQRRLDDPEDFVRLEVEAGLSRDNVLVIPVLVDEASPPNTSALPPSLAQLAYRNAISVRKAPDFHKDVDRLISQIRRQTPHKMRWWMFAILAGIIIFLVIGGALAINQPENDTGTSQTMGNTPNISSPGVVTPGNSVNTLSSNIIATLYRGRDSVAFCSDDLTNLRNNVRLQFGTAQTQFALAELNYQQSNPCICIQDEDQRMSSNDDCTAENTTLTSSVDWLNTNIHVLVGEQQIGRCPADPNTQSIYTCAIEN